MIWKASVNVFLIALLSMVLGAMIAMLIQNWERVQWGGASTTLAALGISILVQIYALRGELLKLKRLALMAGTAEQFQ